MRKISKITVGAIAGALLLFGYVNPASAEVGVDQSGGSTAVHEDQIVAELREVAKTQTQAETEAIWNGEAPASGLVGDDGSILAAIPTPTSDMVVPFLEVPCSSGTAETKVWQGSTLTKCYALAGINIVNLTNVSNVWAGSANVTVVKYNGSASTYIPANNSSYFTAGWHVGRVTRH